MESIIFRDRIIITSTISILLGLFFLFLNRANFGRGKSFWCAGALIFGISLPLKFFPSTHAFSSAILPHSLVVLSFYLYLAGIWQFKEKRIYKRIILGIPLFTFILSILFTYLFPLPNLLFSFYFGFVILCCLVVVYELTNLRGDQQYLKNIFKICAISYIVIIFLAALNLYRYFFPKNSPPFLLQYTDEITFIICIVFMVSVTMGFLSALNIRLNHELNNQLTAKNKFFSILAHDLRGSLGSIMNFSNLINSNVDFNEEEIQKFMKSIETLSQSTFHLLQNLLEWATSSQSSVTPEGEIINVNHIIHNHFEYFNSISKIKSINLSFHPGERATILGNTKMIEAVIRNLFSNATKFTHPKGKITITTSHTQNKRVRITVRDNGIGISPDKLKTITRFDKSKPLPGTNGETGSGLGLALCKELIREQNGTILIESELNKGTSVTVEFPAL